MTITQTYPKPRPFDVSEYYAMAAAGILREEEHLELLDGVIFLKYADSPRLFDVGEYYAMAAAGILRPDERLELLRGRIFVMSPIGSRHAASVNGTSLLLREKLGRRGLVSAQNPVRLDDGSEPEPDVAVVSWRDDFYAYAHPTPSDVLLIVEVGDTSADFDREEKLPLYAGAGVREVWLANLPSQAVEVYTDPLHGEYSARRVFGAGDVLTPTAFSDVRIPVSQILLADV